MIELDNEKIKQLYLATKLNQRLIIERNELSLSRGQMAEKCGVSTYTYGKWEKGDSIPEPEKIIELFKLLNLDIHDFLSKRHSVILDVRILIQQELNEIRKRKYELQDMLRFYAEEETDMVQLLEEDCSFNKEYEDVEMEESFEGVGNWLSPKWIYFRKGLYIFKVNHQHNKGYVNTRTEIINLEGKNRRIVSLGTDDKEVAEPISIDEEGYYLIHVETDAKVEWSLQFTNDLFEWNEILNRK